MKKSDKGEKPQATRSFVVAWWTSYQAKSRRAKRKEGTRGRKR